MWKKRLFEEISNDINNDHYTDSKRRKPLDQLPCPQCSSYLIASSTGLGCPNCSVNIPISCQQDLSPRGIMGMIDLAKQQHGLCSSGGSKVDYSTLGLPDNDLFLTWTCGGCGLLEILL